MAYTVVGFCLLTGTNGKQDTHTHTLHIDIHIEPNKQ